MLTHAALTLNRKFISFDKWHIAWIPPFTIPYSFYSARVFASTWQIRTISVSILFIANNLERQWSINFSIRVITNVSNLGFNCVDWCTGKRSYSTP